MGRRKRNAERRPDQRPSVECHVEGLLGQIRYRRNRIDLSLIGEQSAMTPAGRLELAAWFASHLGGPLDDWLHWIMSPKGTNPRIPGLR